MLDPRYDIVIALRPSQIRDDIGIEQKHPLEIDLPELDFGPLEVFSTLRDR
jgi:hypothetical protein